MNVQNARLILVLHSLLCFLNLCVLCPSYWWYQHVRLFMWACRYMPVCGVVHALDGGQRSGYR